MAFKFAILFILCLSTYLELCQSTNDSPLNVVSTENPNDLEDPNDGIEVAKRLFGLNLNIGNPFDFGSTTSPRQGIYTSVPPAQRALVERACQGLMASMATVHPRSLVPNNNAAPDATLDDKLPHLALRRWSGFNWFGSNDPYIKVMNDCTQIVALMGSPSVVVPAVTQPPAQVAPHPAVPPAAAPHTQAPPANPIPPPATHA